MPSIVYENCIICQSNNLIPFLSLKDHSISGEDFKLTQCENCNFIFTQNVPDENEAGKYYQSDSYVSHSDTSNGLIFKLYHLVRNIMLHRKFKILKDTPAKKTLLDVGSGTGYFLNYMKLKGFQTTGIEIDKSARELSISKFGLDVYPPDFLKKTSPKQKFGYITLWHVLEHLYNLDDYFKIFHDLLEDEGFLIIAIPNHKSFDAKRFTKIS